jgi:hypothetical protein
MKKIIISGIVAGIAVLVLSLLWMNVFGMAFPAVAAEYKTSMFRPWTDPLMTAMFAYPFILGIALAWAWNKAKGLFKQKEFWQRGAMFGASVWLISSIPGMFITYTTFVVSFAMIMEWTLGGLLYCVVSGIIFAKLNK